MSFICTQVSWQWCKCARKCQCPHISHPTWVHASGWQFWLLFYHWGPEAILLLSLQLSQLTWWKSPRGSGLWLNHLQDPTPQPTRTRSCCLGTQKLLLLFIGDNRALTEAPGMMSSSNWNGGVDFHYLVCKFLSRNYHAVLARVTCELSYLCSSFPPQSILQLSVGSRILQLEL